MNLETWFAVPIWNTVVDLSDSQRQEAIKFCLDLKEQSLGRVVSNMEGWQSNDLYEDDLLRSPLQFLPSAVMPACQEAIESLGVNRRMSVANTWINVSSKGAYNVLHNHANCALTCVFYLTEDNSAIKFERPFDVAKYYLEQVGSTCATELSFANVRYTPSKNTLLVFPPWLQHSVETNQNDTVRISVAMNMKFVNEQVPNTV